MSGVSFSKLRIIPKSMADAVMNTKNEMFAVLLQGYDLSDNEITVQTARLMDVKNKLEYCKKAYEDVEAGYLDPDIPRIVPDDEMDKYMVSEQLAYTPQKEEEIHHSNLFGKLTTSQSSFLSNKYSSIRNDERNCMGIATEIKEIMNVDLKKSLETVKLYVVDNKPVDWQPGFKMMTSKRKVSKELETAYNGMISACEVLGEPKYKVDRLIEPKKKSEGGGYDYSAKLKTEVAADKKAENKVAAKTLKDEYLSKLSDAISASQNYIDKLYEEIEKKREKVNKRREEERKNKKKGKKTEKKGSDSRVVHIVEKDDANKYDEYVSAKAFQKAGC